MTHKICFEGLDKSLKDIMSDDKIACKQIFWEKIVIFGGDFRQILPVILRETRSDIVHAIINASYIWDTYTIFTLTQNMRLQSGSNSFASEDIQKNSEWILKICDENMLEKMMDMLILVFLMSSC